MNENKYYILNVRKVDIPLVYGDSEILQFLKEMNESNIETLESLVKNMDNIGPFNISFIFGFGEGILKKSMLRTVLDMLQKRGLITIDGNKVKITEVGKIAIEGIENKNDLRKISSTLMIDSDGLFVLEYGFYIADVDRVFEHDGVIIPSCYLGVHTQFVKKGERSIEFVIPIRTKIPHLCELNLLEI